MSTVDETPATVDEVREVAETVVDDLDLQPYMNCGPISDAIRKALEEELGLETAYVEDGNVRDGPEYAEHAYVVVPTGVADKRGDVIVDGSIRQFDRDHYDDGRAWVCLEDEIDGELPHVAVIGENDLLHDHYTKWRPF